MNYIAAILIAVSLPQLECTWKDFNFSDVLPWADKVPIKDYNVFIEVRLVKKDWMPETPTLPTGDEVVDNYPGSLDEAYTLFKKTAEEYSYEYNSRLLKDAIELLTSPEYGYNPKLPSIFIIHTISEDANKHFVRNTVTALALRNFVKNYNVFTLNMPDLQKTMEQSIWYSLFGNKANLYGFGKAIGTFFQEGMKENLITLDQINIISFCFSSQLAGYVGRYMTHYHGHKIKSILGMDPYSILLSTASNGMLSSKDAQTVHIYHTNSAGFGSFKRRATADFIINNGSIQPGCPKKKNPFIILDCSHQRAVMILWYSLLYPDLFVARRCSLYVLFRACLCKSNPTGRMSFPPNPSTKGRYYMQTTDRRPYAMGPPSARCDYNSQK